MEEEFSSEEISSDEEVRNLHRSDLDTGGHEKTVPTHVAFFSLQLQEEFSKGNLQPGLIVRKAPLKTYTNNVVSFLA